MRLCARYSEFWLRRRCTRSFVVVYFSLIPSYSLRFEEDREVRYFVGRNIAGYLVVSLGLVDQNT